MRVLLVEDDLAIQDEMKSLIKDEVISLHVASNGQEGYEFYVTYKPDIIITDERMPIMNGLEMSEKIKKENPNQAIVLFTALRDTKTLEKAININIDKLVLKPLNDFSIFLEKLGSIANNISAEKQLKSYLHQLSEKNKIIDEHVMYSVSDLDGNVTEASNAFLDLSGFSIEEVVGKNHSIFKTQESQKQIFIDMWDDLNNDKTWRGELENRTKDGVNYWIKAVIVPCFNEEGIKVGYTAIKEDMTDKKRIEFLSEHDTLTGIYNRRKLEMELLRYKDKVDRYHIECCLILVDIDKFKNINDSFGHLIGDKILKEFTNILNINIRKTDILARWGGEEFMIIVPYLDCKSASVLAEKLRGEIESFEFTKNIKITSSFGVSFLAYDKTINDAISNVDKALYKAKSNGRNLVSMI